jgi:hypothetical protein
VKDADGAMRRALRTGSKDQTISAHAAAIAQRLRADETGGRR